MLKTYFLLLISLGVSANIFSQSYPSVSCNSNGNYKINRVNIEGIYQDYNTGASSYTDYTDGLDDIDKALVVRGETYELKVRVDKNSKRKYTTVWIDWNDDGDFTDSGEEYVLGTNVKTRNFTVNLTIPLTSAIGKIRMRIVTLKGSAPTSAGAQGNKGEAEDYALSVGDIGDFLYYTSDEEDARYKIDKNTGYITWLENNDVDDIESMAIWPVQGYSTYFAANGGDFGSLGLESGYFTLISDIDTDGPAQGADGGVSLSDVDGMGFDARTGILWASNRRSGYDILFQINPTTGKYVQDAFGHDIDYVVIDGTGVYETFDDIAISPINGKVYGISNNGSNDQLLEINPLTGAVVVDKAVTGASDIEGLTFDNRGVLYGTSGTADEMYTINPSNGAATLVGEAYLWGEDVEAIIALTDEANKITGTVWKDDNKDGIKDGGESTGISGVTVELWYDANNNGEVDSGDDLLQSAITNASGNYYFDYATTGHLAMKVKTSTLPAGYALTTDNKEQADFTTLGNTNTNNNFGAETGADCDGDGIPDFAEGDGDSDGDGVDDKCDKDSDNDGIIDADEGTKDTDGDGIKDYLDLDSDNDGIPDAIEANGGFAPSGYSSSTARIGGSDSDGDGIMNSVDAGSTSTLANYDSDGDGVNDYRDLDSDNDGILDLVEAGGDDADKDGKVDAFSDANNDGYHNAYASSPLPIYNNDSSTEAVALPNYRDIDSDGDSIDDTREGYSPADYSSPSIIKDSDGDGIINHWDKSSGGESITPFDYDSDGVPDYQDQDSDNDGGSDIVEGNDANGNGSADSSPSGIDSDKNGMDDTFDQGCAGESSITIDASSKCEERTSNGDCNTGSSDIELVYDGRQQIVGIRFTGVNIEQGAEVVSAFIQFTDDEGGSGTTDLYIKGHDVNNASNFSESDDNVSNRSRTSARVNWSPENWDNSGESGSDQKTPNLKTIVQEIIDRGGWNSGNAMVFIIEGTSTSNTRTATYNAARPQLIIKTADGLKYDCGSNIALNDNNSNSKQDFRDIDEVLPISLIDFSAKLYNKDVLLEWSTASEENNDYFIVQKSSDGYVFEEMEIVDGAGNSNMILNYQSFDNMPFEGTNYYRLKQIDIDGQYTYSNIVVIKTLSDDIISVYPNPSDGIMNIESSENIEVLIYSSIGQVVASYHFEKNSLNKIDISNQPKGLYFVCYIVNDKRILKKIVVK